MFNYSISSIGFKAKISSIKNCIFFVNHRAQWKMNIIFFLRIVNIHRCSMFIVLTKTSTFVLAVLFVSKSICTNLNNNQCDLNRTWNAYHHNYHQANLHKNPVDVVIEKSISFEELLLASRRISQEFKLQSVQNISMMNQVFDEMFERCSTFVVAECLNSFDLYSLLLWSGSVCISLKVSTWTEK